MGTRTPDLIPGQGPRRLPKCRGSHTRHRIFNETRRRNGMTQASKSNKVVVETIEVPAERKHFKNLMLANPNYFGTFPDFSGKVIKAFSGNTTYEQLACLGLNPGGLFGGG